MEPDPAASSLVVMCGEVNLSDGHLLEDETAPVEAEWRTLLAEAWNRGADRQVFEAFEWVLVHQTPTEAEVLGRNSGSYAVATAERALPGEWRVESLSTCVPEFGLPGHQRVPWRLADPDDAITQGEAVALEIGLIKPESCERSTQPDLATIRTGVEYRKDSVAIALLMPIPTDRGFCLLMGERKWYPFNLKLVEPLARRQIIEWTWESGEPAGR